MKFFDVDVVFARADILQPEIVARQTNVSSSLTVEEFLACYDTYFSQVYNYICYRCGDSLAADDLTATVFERALMYLGDYRSERGSLKAWLFAIARNTVNNHFRLEKRRFCVSLERQHEYEYPDPNRTPEEAVLQLETQQALLAAIQKLDDRARDLLGLKFGAHMTNRRIAEITGLSEANVGVIIHRALNRLRAEMKE